MPDITVEHNEVLDARKEYHNFIRKYSEQRIRNSLTITRRMNDLEQNLINKIDNLNKKRGKRIK